MACQSVSRSRHTLRTSHIHSLTETDVHKSVTDRTTHSPTQSVSHHTERNQPLTHPPTITHSHTDAHTHTHTTDRQHTEGEKRVMHRGIHRMEKGWCGAWRSINLTGQPGRQATTDRPTDRQAPMHPPLHPSIYPCVDTHNSSIHPSISMCMRLNASVRPSVRHLIGGALRVRSAVLAMCVYPVPARPPACLPA